MSVPTLRLNDRGVYEIYWTEMGRGKRVSTRLKNAPEALAFFGRWLLERAGAPVGERRTIGELWAAYDAQHVSDPARVADPDSVRYSWRNLKHGFASRFPSDIKQADVDDYLARRIAGRIGRPSSDGTVRKELLALRACLNWCADRKRGLISADDVPAFDLPPESAPRERWLTRAEIERLLRWSPPNSHKSSAELFIVIALETGARKQAILDLTWDRVDFEAGVIHFAVPGVRETKKARPSVPMSATLRRILEIASAHRQNDLVLGKRTDVWAAVKAAAKRAGLEDVSPHTLRHSAATHMARNGVPLWQIAKILGNSLAMVERVYAKWCPDSPETTVDLISGKRDAA